MYICQTKQRQKQITMFFTIDIPGKTHSNLKTATVADFKEGKTLFSVTGYGYTLAKKYEDGIWRDIKGTIVREQDAHTYKVFMAI